MLSYTKTEAPCEWCGPLKSVSRRVYVYLKHKDFPASSDNPWTPITLCGECLYEVPDTLEIARP